MSNSNEEWSMGQRQAHYQQYGNPDTYNQSHNQEIYSCPLDQRWQTAAAPYNGGNERHQRYLAMPGFCSEELIQSSVAQQAALHTRPEMKLPTRCVDLQPPLNLQPSCDPADMRHQSNYDHSAVISQSTSLSCAKRKSVEEEKMQNAAYQHQQSNKTSATVAKNVKKASQKSAQPSRRYLYIHTDASEQWKDWFRSAFEAVQQIACRHIAKEWIRTIHPKKQSTHPYNGRVTGRKEVSSSENTKPPYWPKEVRHKEPDHIDKKERIELLVHLLTNTPYRQIKSTQSSTVDVTAKTLLAALERRGEEHVKAKWSIVCQIVEARVQVETSLKGGYGANPIVKVPHYTKSDAHGVALDDGDDNDEYDTVSGSRQGKEGKVMIVDDEDDDEESVVQPLVHPAGRPSKHHFPQQPHYSLAVATDQTSLKAPSIASPPSVWPTEYRQAWPQSHSVGAQRRHQPVPGYYNNGASIHQNNTIQWSDYMSREAMNSTHIFPAQSVCMQPASSQTFSPVNSASLDAIAMSEVPISYATQMQAQRRL